MLEFIRNITARRDQDGASAVEYGLLVAGIAALIVTVVFVFGGVIKKSFSSTCGTISVGATARRPPAAADVCVTDPGAVAPGSVRFRGHRARTSAPRGAGGSSGHTADAPEQRIRLPGGGWPPGPTCPVRHRVADRARQRPDSCCWRARAMPIRWRVVGCEPNQNWLHAGDVGSLSERTASCFCTSSKAV